MTMGTEDNKDKPDQSEYGGADRRADKSGDPPGKSDPEALGPDYKYEHGVLVYTDPSSKQEYILNSDHSDWIPKPDYEFDGETYYHTDDKGKKFKWNLKTNEWEEAGKKEEEAKKEDSESQKVEEVEEEDESEEDDDTTDQQRREKQFRKRKAAPGWGSQANTQWTDPETGTQYYKDSNDGMVYEWDRGRGAWFPKIDEDFMAQYQMNYGFTKDGTAQPTIPEEKPPEEPEEKKAKTEKKESKKPEWFEQDETKTTKVYVSNLPLTFDEEKFIEFMEKCGMLELDVRSNTKRIKMYKDENGEFKGDGLATYMKVESVELALTILDGSTVDGKVVQVERAKFEMKGGKYDPKLKPKKLGKKERERLAKHREKVLAWNPDKMRGERSKRDRIIVIKGLFDPAEFDKDASKILEYSGRIREYCSKFGKVRKVVLYDKHPEGVCQVFFAGPDEADIAIAMIDGRMFENKRVMSASTWDGKTKYKVDETAEEEKARLAKWDKFLEETCSDDEK